MIERANYDALMQVIHLREEIRRIISDEDVSITFCGESDTYVHLHTLNSFRNAYEAVQAFTIVDANLALPKVNDFDKVDSAYRYRVEFEEPITHTAVFCLIEAAEIGQFNTWRDSL